MTGALRFSISWFNSDDLDAHMQEPNGFEIDYSSMRSPSTGGVLDVDMNVSTNGPRFSLNAVENITYPNKHRINTGVYEAKVHQYTKRGRENVGFDAELEYEGVIHKFSYHQDIPSNAMIAVAKFEITKDKELKILSGLPSSAVPQEHWGIHTTKFHKVNMIMHSPNHWNGQGIGNRHYFFVLDGCTNPEPARGFYNEFLNPELTKHRKVFEVLGSKMKTEMSDMQLSGLGFSTTKRAHVYCKVTGAFTRMLKIQF